MVVSRIASAIAALVMMAGAAFACDGTEVFSDDFSDPELSGDIWSANDPAAGISISLGYLEINAEIGYTNQVPIPGVSVEFDACVDIVMPSAKEPDGGTDGGLIFWLKDWDNFYQVATTPAGGLGVFRVSKGRATTVSAPFKIYGQINKGAGAKNTFRVVLKGSKGTVYANGERLTAFKVVAADAKQVYSNLSLYGRSEANQRNPWRFSNVMVAEPE